MKYFLGLWFVCLCWSETIAQKSDFIVIRNKQSRTLRSYFPGSFINADTYAGFTLNGYIRKIAHDSLYVEQENVYQVATQFGTPALDTIRYLIPIYYKEIRKFNYEIGSRQSGGSSLLLPKILLYGGAGYIVLELVNTAYRKESLDEGNKLTSLAIAGGVALTGFIWQEAIKSKQRKGKKVTVEYIKMAD